MNSKSFIFSLLIIAIAHTRFTRDIVPEDTVNLKGNKCLKEKKDLCNTYTKLVDLYGKIFSNPGRRLGFDGKCQGYEHGFRQTKLRES